MSGTPSDSGSEHLELKLVTRASWVLGLVIPIFQMWKLSL